MRAAEMGDLGRLPAHEAVAPGERLEHPGVDGKGLQPARAEEQDAVGDLLPDAGQFQQARLGRGIGQVLGFLQPARAGGDED